MQLSENMRRWKRIVLAPFAVLGAIWALHLVAMNVALNTGIARGVISRELDPIGVRLNYDRAFSLFPGHMWMTNLRLEGRDSHVEWKFSAERSMAIVDPIAMFRREYVALYSSTEGARIELYDRPAKEPDPTIDPTKVWDVILKGGKLQLVGIHVDETRFSGLIEVRGDFELRPGGMMRWERSEMEIQEGELWVGRARAAHEIRGRGTSHLAGIPVEKTGEMLFANLESETQLQAEVGDLWFLNRLLRGAPFVKFESGHGKLRLETKTREGQLQAGSSMSFQAPKVAVSIAGEQVTATASVGWSVERRGRRDISELDVKLRKYSVRRKGESKAHIRGDRLRMVARADSRLKPVSFYLDVPRAAITDIRIYQKYIPAGIELTLERGVGSIEGWIEIPEKAEAARGRFVVSAKNVRAKFKDLPLRGNLSFESNLSEADLVKRKLSLDGSKFVISGVEVGGVARDWWSETTFLEAKIDGDSKHAIFTAKAETRLKDISPLLALFALQGELPRFLAGVIDVQNAFSTLEIEVGEDKATVEKLNLYGNSLKIEGVFQISDRRNRGAMRAEYMGIPVGVRIDGDQTQVRVIGPSRPLQEEKRALGIN